MLLQVFNHFRLTWQLLFDRRVGLWLKLFILGLPLAYMALPVPFLGIPDDFLCVVGLLDDLLFLAVATIIFNALCPRAITYEHEMVLQGNHPSAEMTKLEAYRNPQETHDLAVGFVSATGLLLLGGYLGGVVLLLFFVIGYIRTNLHRASMLANAIQVSDKNLPRLYPLLRQAQKKLPSVEVSLFVTQNPVMNAYTFGYHEPYCIVLNSALVEKLSNEEIQAIIGHEVGHVLFGHTRILSVLGTQTGLGALLFYKWSRSAEYSADAAALLASGGAAAPVISSLLKLTSGLADTIDVQGFLAQLKKGTADNLASNYAQLLSTHPTINNRILNLLRPAQSTSSR